MAMRTKLFANFLLLYVVVTSGAATSQVVIPFRQDGLNKLIFLDARINGKPARLLLDCGASITIVDARLLEIGQWDLRAAKFSTRGPGLAGEAVWAEAVLAVGSIKGARRRVAAMNLEVFAGSLGQHVDGLLGQDFLSEFHHVAIDFKERKLLLSP